MPESFGVYHGIPDYIFVFKSRCYYVLCGAKDFSDFAYKTFVFEM